MLRCACKGLEVLSPLLEDVEHSEETPQESIHRIGLRDLLSGQRLRQIYAGRRIIIGVTSGLPEFFVAQAKAGLISISYETGKEDLGQVLLPQIHSANAVLDWGDLHLSKSTRRWMRSDGFREAGYRLSVDHSLGEVLEGIARCHGEANWMDGRYPALLESVKARRWANFELLPVGIVDGEGTLLGGEIGCVTGKVYTSMSGFLDRSAPGFNHVGKLQLYWLGEYLRDAGFAFWNLGQPYMEYKFALGAKKVPRVEFLQRWWGAANSLLL